MVLKGFGPGCGLKGRIALIFSFVRLLLSGGEGRFGHKWTGDPIYESDLRPFTGR